MLRDLRWVSVAETLSQVASFVTVPLLTRALVPADYGLYKSVFLAFSLFFVVYGVSNVSPLLGKRLPEVAGRRRAELVSASTVVLLCLSALAFLALLGATYVALLSRISPALQRFVESHLPLLGALFFATLAYRFVLALVRGVDHFQAYSVIKLLRETVFLCAVVWLSAAGGLTVTSALWFLLLGNLSAVLVGGWTTRSLFAVAPDFGHFRDQFREISLPQVPQTLIKKVKETVPDAVVLATFGSSVFAAWSVVFAFTAVFRLVSRPFSSLLLPKISKRLSEGRSLHRLVSRYYRVMAVLVCPAVVGGALIGPDLVTHVFGSSYLYDPALVVVLIAAFGVQTMNTLAGSFFVGTGRSIYTTYNQALSGAILLGFTVVGAFVVDSLLVVALGYLAENLASLAFALWYQSRIVDVPRPSPTSLAQFAVALAVMAGAVVALSGYVSDVESAVALVAVGAVTYFLTLALVGFVSEEDVSLLRRFVGA